MLSLAQVKALLLGAAAPALANGGVGMEALDRTHEARKRVLVDLRRTRDDIADLERRRRALDARIDALHGVRRTLEDKLTATIEEDRATCRRFVASPGITMVDDAPLAAVVVVDAAEDGNESDGAAGLEVVVGSAPELPPVAHHDGHAPAQKHGAPPQRQADPQ